MREYNLTSYEASKGGLGIPSETPVEKKALGEGDGWYDLPDVTKCEACGAKAEYAKGGSFLCEKCYKGTWRDRPSML